MNIQVSAFLTHKVKETMDDCFDRYALGPTYDRFIVADGVSNSFFPGIWTELLCQAFVDYQEGDFNPADPKCNEFINGYRRKWKEEVSQIANRPSAKFFTKRLFFQGNTAACAYVGFHFIWDSRYNIQTFALGDCCIFVFTDHKLPYELLFSSLKDTYVFNNFPNYVDSKPDERFGETVIEAFELPNTGLIIMASDALSKWIFENYAGDNFERMVRLGSQEEFIIWVDEVRQLNEYPLENDDVVLFRIAFSGSAEQEIVVEEGSLFVIPSPPFPDEPLIETGAAPDEAIDFSKADLGAVPVPKASVEDGVAQDEPTNSSEANLGDEPELGPNLVDIDKLDDDKRERSSGKPISFQVETKVKNDPLLSQEIAPTPVIGLAKTSTRSPWNKIAERTLDILENAKEGNLVTAFSYIIRQGFNDIIMTIQAVVDYPLDDGEKIKLIKAILEADTIKNNQN